MYEYQSISKIKVSLIVLTLVASFFLYDRFLVQTASAQDAGTASPINAEALALLNKIESIKLDYSIIQDSYFKSLIDFTPVVNPEVPGRDNPFAPFAQTKSAQNSQNRGR